MIIVKIKSEKYLVSFFCENRVNFLKNVSFRRTIFFVGVKTKNGPELILKKIILVFKVISLFV